MQLFYLPDLKGNQFLLPEEESKHCIKVLRMQAGDEITLIDGHGTLVTAKIVDTHPKRCVVEAISRIEEFEKRPFRLNMAVAPTKNIDRFEWFIEKATEIGADCFTPIISEHSERKQVNIERVERIIVSAVKQSIKAYKPTIAPQQTFKEFINGNHSGDLFIAHCQSKNLPLLNKKVTPGAEVTILIGPEGDFSPLEIELALAKGFAEISLGPARLRTETAALAACHIANIANY